MDKGILINPKIMSKPLVIYIYTYLFVKKKAGSEIGNPYFGVITTLKNRRVGWLSTSIDIQFVTELVIF